MRNVESHTDSAISLLCLYYPQQLLPALASLISLRRAQAMAEDNPAIALIWMPPGTPREIRERRLKTFSALLDQFPWVKLLAPSDEEVSNHLSQHLTVMRKAAYLRGLLAPPGISDMHYAHDISADFLAQSVMQAFPQATRVCYGDALGVVYENSYFESVTYPLNDLRMLLKEPVGYARNIAARLRRRWLRPGRTRQLEATHASLILPCDPGQNFLRNKSMLPVQRRLVLDLLRALSRGLCNHKLGGLPTCAGQEQACLMILGSYAESKLCAVENEVALYVDAARRHVPAGGTLILKPHPASRREKVVLIAQSLSASYNVGIVDEEMDEVPVETLVDATAQLRILSFSYVSVSMTYLGARHVEHVLTDELIDLHFPPKTRDWIRDSNELYLGQLMVASKLNMHSESLPCPE